MNDNIKDVVKKSLLEDRTIEGLLVLRKAETTAIDEYFDVTWRKFHSTDNFVKVSHDLLIYTRIRILFMKIVASLLEEKNIRLEIDSLIKLINDYLAVIKEEEQLCAALEIALERLQQYKVTDCNKDLCKIFDLLYTKNNLILSDITNKIRLSGIKINGLNVQSPKNTSLEEIDSSINEKVLALGIRKNNDYIK